MLDFYRDYEERPKLQPLVAEISWSKNLLVMARCKDDLEREFCEFQNPKEETSAPVTAAKSGRGSSEAYCSVLRCIKTT